MSNPRINPQPRNAMEAAWFKAVQKRAAEKPKQQPQPAQQPQGKKP